jgi:hypothetical protein
MNALGELGFLLLAICDRMAAADIWTAIATATTFLRQYHWRQQWWRCINLSSMSWLAARLRRAKLLSQVDR